MALAPNTTHCVDCLAGMEAMAAESVDVIVTSPPYNRGVAYNTYDDNRDFADYVAWLRAVFAGCRRVLKEDGSFFFNIGDRPSEQLVAPLVAREAADGLFTCQNILHWIKSIAATPEDVREIAAWLGREIPASGVHAGHYKPTNSHRYLTAMHEYIFHFTKTGDVRLDKEAVGVPYADKSNIGRYNDRDRRDRGNTWFIDYDTVQEKKAHPAGFPVELPRRCIRLHGVAQVELVLDPFMGSGSTAVAAVELGVDYLGFDIDPAYVELANARARAAVDAPVS